MKEYYISNVKIIEHENKELEDINVLRKNLIHLYDVINEVASTLPKEKTKDWFLSDKDIERMKKSGKYNFI